jgi:hypothetical protein
MIQIIFGTYIPPSDRITSVYNKDLHNGFEMNANDELSNLFFTHNGNILIEISPELGVIEKELSIPIGYNIMRLTHNWNILFPQEYNSNLAMMDLRFIYKGHEQGLVIPTVSAPMIRTSISASIYFSVQGSAQNAFWGITANVNNGIKFWFRERNDIEWISQIQVGSMTLAGYRSIVRRIDLNE